MKLESFSRHETRTYDDDGSLLATFERPQDAAKFAVADDLLTACKLQHAAIDLLFAMLMQVNPRFMPSQSGKPWEALLAGNAAIAKAEQKA